MPRQRRKRTAPYKQNHPSYGYCGTTFAKARGRCECHDCESRRGVVDHAAIARYLADKARLMQSARPPDNH